MCGLCCIGNFEKVVLKMEFFLSKFFCFFWKGGYVILFRILSFYILFYFKVVFEFICVVRNVFFCLSVSDNF